MIENIPDNLVAKTWSKALTPPKTIPSSADVVIIGGGIVGVSTAWFQRKHQPLAETILSQRNRFICTLAGAA